MLKIIIGTTPCLTKTIVWDLALEAALGKRKVYVREVRDIVYRQLVISEPYQWPLPSNAPAGVAMAPPR
jgi:hypothetical protein